MIEHLLGTLGPLHPPLTHFPIVCSILAVVCLTAFGWSRKPWLQEATAWLGVLTFLSGLASGISGHLFSQHLGLENSFSLIPSGNILGGLLRDHVLWASGGLVVSLLGLVSARATLKGKAWPFGAQMGSALLAAVLFGLAGDHGGQMVYGGPKALPGTDPQEEKASGLGPRTTGPDLLAMARDHRKEWRKVNGRSWVSRTHGHRWVNTYVSPEAVQAYNAGEALPENAWVLKESFQDVGGKPGAEGPLYVMHKGRKGSSPTTGGWEYALQWDHPVAGNPEKLSAPAHWLPGDPGLASCVRCHNRFKSTDYLGGIPEDGEAP